MYTYINRCNIITDVRGSDENYARRGHAYGLATDVPKLFQIRFLIFTSSPSLLFFFFVFFFFFLLLKLSKFSRFIYIAFILYTFTRIVSRVFLFYLFSFLLSLSLSLSISPSLFRRLILIS